MTTSKCDDVEAYAKVVMEQAAADLLEGMSKAKDFGFLEAARSFQKDIEGYRVERDEAREDLEAITEKAAVEIKQLRAEVEKLRALLIRYRNETPLGHQPHMIAHEVDAALKETK